MKYTCWGAAKQVTGSMHLLELDSGYKILVDCGIDYEDKDNKTINSHFQFNPKDIDVLLLTHAHIDHSGNIPNLVKQGFKGEIICTEPTAFLLDKLWIDSVNIQNNNFNRRKTARLYGFKEVKEANEQLLTVNFNQKFTLNSEVPCTFHEAGHIIGAASIRLEVTEENSIKTIGFTGDLGNPGSKLIVDPEPMQGLNYLITETTYGNRQHKEKRSPEDVLIEYVTKTCVDQEGRLIIPAFSVGRTQVILFTLKKLFNTGILPPIRVFADSPLALASSNIHNRFSDYLNDEAKNNMLIDGSLFDFKSLYLVEDKSDVEDMELYRDSCIIVSSAGMLEGGRIQHHITDHIQNPSCTILIAGFCSPGTLGAQLLEGRSMIRVKGNDKYVYAKIDQTDVFSAHPDTDGLQDYFEATHTDQLTKIFFVHGEEESMYELKSLLSDDLQKKVVIPSKGESFKL
ncbi:MBL fold metallo-hydrolase [Bacteroidia bacterium]|nr:MBL fold metallo-hydrolase [Bacteroidia bacterium]